MAFLPTDIQTTPTAPMVVRNFGFLSLHAACLLVFLVPVTPLAVVLAIASHAVRAFGLTAGFHRYFAHKSYSTSRPTQFALGFLGTTAAQMGPLWWAGHHVLHHRYADTEQDIHSPSRKGFFWSHVGWFLSGRYMKTNPVLLKRFAESPEIDLLDKYFRLPPLLFAGAMAGLGALVGHLWPHTEASALQFLVWGFIIPTVTIYHATFAVNSLCHMWGYRNFETPDHSRNNPLVALCALGEGWHNNHHRHPGAASHTVRPWEIDLTYYGLRFLEKLKLVTLRTVPKS